MSIEHEEALKQLSAKIKELQEKFDRIDLLDVVDTTLGVLDDVDEQRASNSDFLFLAAICMAYLIDQARDFKAPDAKADFTSN